MNLNSVECNFYSSVQEINSQAKPQVLSVHLRDAPRLDLPEALLGSGRLLSLELAILAPRLLAREAAAREACFF